MFLPKDNSGDEGGEGVETSTAKKEVASSILEEGKRGEKGVVTAKGFWMGVDEGEEVELSHFILIPVSESTSLWLVGTDDGLLIA